mgnify:CR=1 FL=1
MKVVNMHEAKTHLSRLVEEAVNGEPFVIARAGTPMVKVVAISDEEFMPRRVGFMTGEFEFPEDIAALANDEIAHMSDGPLFPDGS